MEATFYNVKKIPTTQSGHKHVGFKEVSMFFMDDNIKDELKRKFSALLKAGKKTEAWEILCNALHIDMAIPEELDSPTLKNITLKEFLRNITNNILNVR